MNSDSDLLYYEQSLVRGGFFMVNEVVKVPSPAPARPKRARKKSHTISVHTNAVSMNVYQGADPSLVLAMLKVVTDHAR